MRLLDFVFSTGIILLQFIFFFAQSGFEPEISFLQPPECSDDTLVPPCLAKTLNLFLNKMS